MMPSFRSINLIENIYDKNDLNLLRHMSTEQIRMYGYPCIFLKYNNDNFVDLDPQYKDSGSNKLSQLYTPSSSYIIIEYENFNDILYSYGYGLSKDQKLEGMMCFEDHPNEEDIIIFKRIYEGKKYIFKLSDANNFKDVCYKVTLMVDIFDTYSQGGLIIP
jgi:hypothetical protein